MKPPKLDPATADAIDLARSAAEQTAGDFGVGEHLGVVAEADRVVTHVFDCPHPGYQGWRWAVTLVRAARAKVPTVNEVALLPGEDAVIAEQWVPWAERIGPGDIAPGMLLATPDNDPRLEPGFSPGDLAPDADPIEWGQTRAVVSELGLGRERVLSRHGRDLAAERWLAGEAGSDDAFSEAAPAPCHTCAYFVPLRGSLGVLFGACTNEYSPFDGHVVSLDHGCGGHSDVTAPERGAELPAPVFDTLSIDQNLFD